MKDYLCHNRVTPIDGGRKMADCNGKKRWDKENVLFVTTKLFRAVKDSNNDQDIIDYLNGKARATIIKQALREYMAHHPQD